jgi:hypothetical protein
MNTSQMNKILQKIQQYTLKHQFCTHECVPIIKKCQEKCCGTMGQEGCGDCVIGCCYYGVGVFCLAKEICGETDYAPMCLNVKIATDNVKVIRKIIHHRCMIRDDV